jgi:hypothetical protein
MSEVSLTTLSVGVAYGSVSRTNGNSASQRSRYQRPGPSGRKRGSQHLRGWLLAPADAPQWAKTPSELWSRAAAAEKRCDAREAIFLDFTWPRCLSLTAADEVIRDIYNRFVAQGLVVQVDLETAQAADGGPNPHVHGLVSARAVDATGFVSRKGGWLADQLHSESGRWARRIVADALTAAAARAQVDVKFDFRSNFERGRPAAEDRIPRSFMRHPDGRVAREMLRRRAAQRQVAAAFRAAEADYNALGEELKELSSKFDKIVLSLLTIMPVAPAAASAPVSLETARRLQADLYLDDRAMPVMIEGLGVVIPAGPGAVVDAGSVLRCEPEIDSDVALVVSRLCRHKGWSKIQISDPSGQPINDSDWYHVEDLPDRHVPEATRRSAVELASLLQKVEADRGLLLSQLSHAAELDHAMLLLPLFERLDIFARADFAPPSGEAILAMISGGPKFSSDLWRRWQANMELAWADMPYTQLGAIFRPGRGIPSTLRFTTYRPYSAFHDSP